MRRIRNILFALAALFWLPVSAHCQLATITGLEFLQCPAENTSSHDSSKNCSCCAAEKAQYRLIQNRLTVPIPVLLPVTVHPIVEPARALPDAVTLGILTAAPPELPKSWYFLSRTALPVRAPSFLS